MMARSVAYTTPTDAPSWKRWLLFSPLARIVIFALLMTAIVFIVGAGLHLAGMPSTRGLPDSLVGAVGFFFLRAVSTALAYWLLVHFIERRRVAELALRKVPHFGAGILLGMVLFSLAMGVLWLAGSYHVSGTNSDVHWLTSILVLGIGAGVSEEIVFRGVLYRIVEEGLGTWAALLVSALAFGAAHLANPNATWWSTLAIAIEAGVLLGLLYHVTRSLWACVGLHAAWNVMEGPVYGASVSGLPPHGWLQSTLDGPAWLSGGTFGPEASLVTMACCALLSLVLLIIALRRGSIVPPPWARRARNIAPTATTPMP